MHISRGEHKLLTQAEKQDFQLADKDMVKLGKKCSTIFERAKNIFRSKEVRVNFYKSKGESKLAAYQKESLDNLDNSYIWIKELVATLSKDKDEPATKIDSIRLCASAANRLKRAEESKNFKYGEISGKVFQLITDLQLIDPKKTSLNLILKIINDLIDDPAAEIQGLSSEDKIAGILASNYCIEYLKRNDGKFLNKDEWDLFKNAVNKIPILLHTAEGLEQAKKILTTIKTEIDYEYTLKVLETKNADLEENLSSNNRGIKLAENEITQVNGNLTQIQKEHQNKITLLTMKQTEIETQIDKEKQAIEKLKTGDNQTIFQKLGDALTSKKTKQTKLEQAEKKHQENIKNFESRLLEEKKSVESILPQIERNKIGKCQLFIEMKNKLEANLAILKDKTNNITNQINDTSEKINKMKISHTRLGFQELTVSPRKDVIRHILRSDIAQKLLQNPPGQEGSEKSTGEVPVDESPVEEFTKEELGKIAYSKSVVALQTNLEEPKKIVDLSAPILQAMFQQPAQGSKEKVITAYSNNMKNIAVLCQKPALRNYVLQLLGDTSNVCERTFTNFMVHAQNTEGELHTRFKNYLLDDLENAKKMIDLFAQGKPVGVNELQNIGLIGMIVLSPLLDLAWYQEKSNDLGTYTSVTKQINAATIIPVGTAVSLLCSQEEALRGLDKNDKQALTQIFSTMKDQKIFQRIVDIRKNIANYVNEKNDKNRCMKYIQPIATGLTEQYTFIKSLVEKSDFEKSIQALSQPQL